jgi:hypothetical protein
MTVRKLIESTFISLDGVIESPERWAIFDEEAAQRPHVGSLVGACCPMSLAHVGTDVHTAGLHPEAQ